MAPSLFMRIALDFDGTFTADPDLWGDFIRSAQDRNHEVCIVTCRTDEAAKEAAAAVKKFGIKVYATNGQPKWDSVYPAIDIWIDDMPHMIFKSVEY